MVFKKKKVPGELPEYEDTKFAESAPSLPPKKVERKSEITRQEIVDMMEGHLRRILDLFPYLRTLEP